MMGCVGSSQSNQMPELTSYTISACVHGRFTVGSVYSGVQGFAGKWVRLGGEPAG